MRFFTDKPRVLARLNKAPKTQFLKQILSQQQTKAWSCNGTRTITCEIPRKMMLWRMQANHLIKRNAPQINIEAS